MIFYKSLYTFDNVKFVTEAPEDTFRHFGADFIMSVETYPVCSGNSHRFSDVM